MTQPIGGDKFIHNLPPDIQIGIKFINEPDGTRGVKVSYIPLTKGGAESIQEMTEMQILSAGRVMISDLINQKLKEVRN